MLSLIFWHFSHWEVRSMAPHLEFGWTCGFLGHTRRKKVNVGHNRPGSFCLALLECLSSQKVSSQNPVTTLRSLSHTVGVLINSLNWMQAQVILAQEATSEWEKNRNARDPTAYLIPALHHLSHHGHLSLPCGDPRHCGAQRSHACFFLYTFLTFRIRGHNNTVVFHASKWLVGWLIMQQ